MNKLSQTPKEFRADEPRTYYHSFNYATFHASIPPNGVETCQFANFRFTTDDKRIQAQLDAIADKPGTFIYTRNASESPAAAAIQREIQHENNVAIVKAANAHDAALNIRADPNAPIVPLVMAGNVAPNLAVAYLAANTGLQSSVSQTQPVHEITNQPTVLEAAPARDIPGNDMRPDANVLNANAGANLNPQNATQISEAVQETEAQKTAREAMERLQALTKS